MGDGMSIADVMALSKDGGEAGSFGGSTWIWVFFLFFLLAWGGGGLFGGRDGQVGVNSPAGQGALTRAELYEGLTSQNIQGDIQGVASASNTGFSNLGYSTLEGFNQVQMGTMQGFNQTQMRMMQGFNGINMDIAQLGFNMQNCCLNNLMAA